MPTSKTTIVGYESYVARQNDSFDLLALQAYGDERLAHIIAKANPDYMPVLVFVGGEVLRIPIINRVETPETLPPWRR